MQRWRRRVTVHWCPALVGERELVGNHQQQGEPLLQLGELLSIDQDVAAVRATSSWDSRRGQDDRVTASSTYIRTTPIRNSTTRQPVASKLPIALGFRGRPRRSTATLKPTLWSVATILFSGLVDGQTIRVVDKGSGAQPRLVVEQRQPADAMGTFGWSLVDPISRQTFEALLIGAGVVH